MIDEGCLDRQADQVPELKKTLHAFQLAVGPKVKTREGIVEKTVMLQDVGAEKETKTDSQPQVQTKSSRRKSRR